MWESSTKLPMCATYSEQVATLIDAGNNQACTSYTTKISLDLECAALVGGGAVLAGALLTGPPPQTAWDIAWDFLFVMTEGNHVYRYDISRTHA